MNDGGPAFPRPMSTDEYQSQCNFYHEQEGMSLRDWFAGQALLGILSGPSSREGVPAAEWFDAPEQAYKLADAMLEERERWTK